MSVAAAAAERNIRELLHFTTNHGLVGILGEGAILSRAKLPERKYVEHVYEPNAQVRRDGPWLDYVNLSVSRLNWEFFGHSRRWHAHRDVWWCALSLSPVILDGDGVLFATTNNIYTGCRRAGGPDGLRAMFAERIVRWNGNVVTRRRGLPKPWTTDHQAEVLVPGRIGTEHVQRIIVATDAHADIAHAQCEILLGDVRIDVDSEAFERHE